MRIYTVEHELDRATGESFITAGYRLVGLPNFREFLTQPRRGLRSIHVWLRLAKVFGGLVNENLGSAVLPSMIHSLDTPSLIELLLQDEFTVLISRLPPFRGASSTTFREVLDTLSGRKLTNFASVPHLTLRIARILDFIFVYCESSVDCYCFPWTTFGVSNSFPCFPLPLFCVDCFTHLVLCLPYFF